MCSSDLPLARSPLDIVIGQLAPSLASGALHLLPFAFKLSPIHEYAPFYRLAANAVAADAVPQSNGLQHKHGYGNHDHDVQNRFDAGSHGDEAIDHPQRHADHDQKYHEIY